MLVKEGWHYDIPFMNGTVISYMWLIVLQRTGHECRLNLLINRAFVSWPSLFMKFIHDIQQLNCFLPLMLCSRVPKP